MLGTACSLSAPLLHGKAVGQDGVRPLLTETGREQHRTGRCQIRFQTAPDELRQALGRRGLLAGGQAGPQFRKNAREKTRRR